MTYGAQPRADISHPPSGPVKWRCRWRETTFITKAQSWFEARHKIATALGCEPQEVSVELFK